MEFNSYKEFIDYLGSASIVNKRDEIETVIESINNFVQTEHSFMEYAPISSFVFSNGLEVVEIAQINLEELLNSDLLKNPLYDKALGAIAKVADHVNLAVAQKTLVEDVVLNQAIEKIKQLEKEIETLEKKSSKGLNEVDIFKTGLTDSRKEISILKQSLDEQDRRRSSIEGTFEQLKLDKTKIYTDFVAILGIFATIIFAAFGGLNLLSGIFDNLKDVKVGKLFIFSSLIIGAIITMLFLLLNGIAKLTGLNLKSCGCHKKNLECNHSWIHQHPSIIIISIFIGFIFLQGTALYFVEYEKIIKMVNAWNLLAQSILLFIPVLIVILFWVFLIKPKLSRNS